MAALENLPKETLIDILSRLPPDSILQFKSASKFWNALIKDSSLLQQKHILLKHVEANEEESGKEELILSIVALTFSTQTPSLDPSVSIVDDVPLPFPFPFFDQKLEHFTINSLSHGLVCLTDSNLILLCNPATREFRKLPSSIILPTDPTSYFYDTTDFAIGFGYDSKSMEFKVVRVVGFAGGGSYNRAEVYDLSKDRWRELQIPPSGDLRLSPPFELYHKGTYYWESVKAGRRVIVFFDMSEEVFGHISLPDAFEHAECLNIGVLNGSIVMFLFPWRRDEKAFDIWDMDKDDESGAISWSKLFTIGPLFGIDMPLLFLTSDQLLMVSNEENLVLYNIQTQQLKTLPIQGHYSRPIEGHFFQVDIYVRSLLSVRRGKSNIRSAMDLKF